MAQKTAVQCLIDELKSGKNLQFEMTKCGHIITEHDNVLNKILQMEKEQIMKAFLDGKVNYRKDWADQYYNETYGKTNGSWMVI